MSFPAELNTLSTSSCVFFTLKNCLKSIATLYNKIAFSNCLSQCCPFICAGSIQTSQQETLSRRNCVFLQQNIKEQLECQTNNESIPEAELEVNNFSIPCTPTGKSLCWTGMKPFNKIIRFLTILVVFSPTYAKPQLNSPTYYTKQLLSTRECNPANVDMTQSCQTDGVRLKLFIDHCKYKSLCSPGEEPVCVDTDAGMVFICAPIGLQCAKGFRWRTWIDKDDHVVKISVEECPSGTFQQHESGCFDACNSKHLDTKSIPKQYVVYSEGDNISPTYVYCNYEEGYFNMKGKFLLDYDQYSMHDPYFCGHIDEFDPCVEGQMPLPNGTCVLPCPQGECRDDHYDFICKPDCRDNGSEGYNAAETGVQKDLGGECRNEFDTCKNGECKRSFGSNVCQCFPGFRNDEETRRCIDENKTSPTRIYVVIGILVAIVTIAFAVLIVVKRFCKRRSFGNGYQGVAMSERRTTDQTEKGSEHSANDISHQITKVKKTKNVTHTTTHIHTNGDVHVGYMNGLATQNSGITVATVHPDTDFTQSCLGHPSNKTTDHQPQMDLEYPVNKECNSATVSSNSTSVKVLS